MTSIPIASLPAPLKLAYRAQAQQRLEQMRNTRLGWWAHWAQLAEMFLPRRYRVFVTPNQWRGSQINSAIVDETGVLAARTMSSGMLSGLTSPTKPWFKLGLDSEPANDFGPVKSYLAECERRMMRVMQESNFYQALAQMYQDLGVFGSASVIIYEDAEDVIRCYNPALGEFFFGSSARLDIDTLAREFPFTTTQCVQAFGLKNLSTSTQQLYRNGGASRETEIVIQHMIEPNTPIYDQGSEKELGYLVPKKFLYREVYWEQSSSGQANDGSVIKVSGFNETPFLGARWDVTSNDAYGRSPGMDALPATRQLQIEQRRKAEAIDKMVRPPMNASVSMKNEPMSIMPGAINYVADLSSSGFAPAYKIEPNIQEMKEDISEVQSRVKSIFFNDLFLMISSLDTVRTATEIDARREEKLVQLGPVIERFENEVLDEAIERIFAIMSRRGLLPPPPPQIAGATINISYVSMLAEAQRAASTTSIERLLQLAGNLAAVDPDIMDNIDLDQTIETYADLLSIPPDLIRPSVVVAQMRAAKAQQAQQAQALQASAAAAQTGQVLSQTNVGGGQNALQLMMQGPQQGTPAIAA